MPNLQENTYKKLCASLFFCYLIAITSFGLCIVRITPFKVEEGTYIGVMVSAMGVLFTVIASYQIYNVIELNHRFKQIEKSKKEVDDLIAKMTAKLSTNDDELHKIFGHSLNNRAFSAIQNNEYGAAFVLMLKAVVEFLEVNDVRNVICEIRTTITNLHNNFSTKNSADVKSKRNEIKELMKKIESHKNFHFILRLFESDIKELNNTLNTLLQ